MQYCVNLIRKIGRFFLRLFHLKRRYTITPSGDCLIRYIINKYINGTTPDDWIEAYEQEIARIETSTSKQARNPVAEGIMKQGIDAATAFHYAAAFNLAVFLTLRLEPQVRQKYVDLIESETLRNLICEMYKIYDGR